jgi:signal transduction histidine kinase
LLKISTFSDKLRHFFTLHMPWLRLVLLGLSLAWSGPGQATPAPAYSGLQAELSLWRDPSGKASLAQARQAQAQGAFQPWDRRYGEVNLAHSSDVLWLRLTLDKPAGLPRLWVLEVPYHGLRALEVYLSGEGLLAEPLQHRFPAFSLPLEDGRNEVFLRASANATLTVPIQVWLPRDFLTHVQNSTMVQALYFGGLAVMVVYNLFLAVSLRDRRFTNYALFGATLFAGMLSGNGYGRLLLWPDSSWFDAVAQAFFLSISAGFSIGFSRHFLRLAQHQRRLDRLLQAGQWAMFAFAPLLLCTSLAASQHLMALQQVQAALVLPLGLLILAAAVRSLRRGVKGIRFFVLAWSVLWLGVFVATFRVWGWLPSTPWTMYAIQIASAAEMLLLALALADIVHQERAARDQAQSASLQLQQQLVEQLRQSEDRLELAVRERTGQLEEALTRQRQMLDQYVRFGALISHEFRNPLGIIESQVSLARKLLPGQAQAGARLDAILGASRRLKQLFERWLQGGRLHTLGEDLRLEPLSLWPWLEDLVAAYPQYGLQHRIVLQPPPGDLRQCQALVDESLLESAVLNLLDNACKYSAPQTEVRLFLQSRAGCVGLAIQDQGPGIAPASQQHIFDEYMRLQPEGPVRGLGLGLALVKRIAELLQASIELRSEVGQGSVFCLWLPTPGPAA